MDIGQSELNQIQHKDVQIQRSALVSKCSHTDVQFRPDKSVTLAMPEKMDPWLDLPIGLPKAEFTIVVIVLLGKSAVTNA